MREYSVELVLLPIYSWSTRGRAHIYSETQRHGLIVRAATNLERFYDIKKDQGEMYNRLSSHRSFILDAESWHGMMAELLKTYSTGFEAILYNAGKAYGKSVIETPKKNYSDKSETLRYLAELAGASGWGMSSLRLKYNKLTIESESYAMAENIGNSSPSCFFLKGVFQGISEVLFGGEATTLETSCKSKGDNRCTFEINFPRMQSE